MSSIGAYRLRAAYVSSTLLVAAVAGMCAYAADCAQGLSREDRISRFKHLDQSAEAQMHTHDFVEAVHSYAEAVCLVPDSARGWYGLAMAQAASKNFAQARESFATADRLQPGSAMPLTMEVRMNFELRDMDAVKSNLRSVAERFPRDSEAHQSLARYLAEQNLFELALAEALRAAEASGNDAGETLQIAGLENTVGAYEDAIRDALQVKADSGTTRELRAAAAGIAGLSHESLGQTTEATTLLHESIDLDPKQENSYLALADLYDQMHRYPDAVQVLTRARATIPNSTAVLLPLGLALIHAEQYAKGIAVLNAAPAADRVYIGLADAARRTGDARQEVDALQQLETFNPRFPMIHVLIARAMVNEAAPDYRRVLEELAAAQKESPSDPEIYYLRGRVYIAQNRPEEAIRDLSHAIELAPLDSGPCYQLARLYQKLGKSQLATQQFERLRYLQQSAAR